MPRYFAPILSDDLRDKIDELDHENGYPEADIQVEKDLKKCSWNTENHDHWMMTLSNGMVCQAHSAGGDWEHPVFYILYWDGKKVRGYIPSKGNPWNHTTKMAYGNSMEYALKVGGDEDKCWDGIDILKRYCTPANGYDPDTEPCDVEHSVPDRDEDAIKQDIMARILRLPKT